MPFSGGTYTAPSSSWNPAVDNTDISSTDWAALLADLSTALSTTICKDGQTIIAANIPMAGFKLTGLGNATAAADAVAYGQSPVLLQTLTASTSAALTFTSFSSTFSTYEFVFSGILAATDNVNFEAQLSSDGGSTWLTAAHYFYGGNYWNNSTIATGGSFATTGANTLWLLNLATGAQLSNANAFNGKMRIQNMNSASLVQMFSSDFAYLRKELDYYYAGTGQGVYETAGVKNGIKFFMSSGNITSGTIKVYGIP